jgi:hypothetical protein
MNDQMAGNVRGEVQKIAQSGAPTEGGLNKFDPNTFTGELANAWQRVSNKPTGANASAFLKQYKDYLNGMKQTTGSLVANYNHSVLDTKGRKLQPDVLQNYLESDYVSPYEQYYTGKQKSTNAQAPAQQGATGQTTKAPLGPNEVRRQTKDGKIAIFDSTTKKFLRYE